jgi:hypothetical protein
VRDVIVVAGALANKPGNGGEAWVRLSWVRGLQRLGFDVRFVEAISQAACVDATGRPATPERSVNTAYFREVVAAVGLQDQASLWLSEGGRLVGDGDETLEGIAAAALLLVNISGHLADREVLRRFRRRAYIDIDPGYTQHWHLQGLLDGILEAHDAFFTVGLNIGRPGCSIPTAGFRWHPVLPPVVLDDWPVAPRGGDRFTTVAAWRGGFGSLEVDGHRYGQKAHEWRRFMDLPARTGLRMEAALSIDAGDGADRQRLLGHGWELVDPGSVAPTPHAFREYVQGSWAEFSVAQGVYVETNSGWVSDRTVRYLASGKPALVQDTGAGRVLPTGEGLLTFGDLDEAAAGAAALASEYVRHTRSARQLAEEHFDSDRVLRGFLELSGA